MPDTAAALLSPAEHSDVDPSRSRATKSRTPGDAADSTGKRKRLANSAPSKDAADSPQPALADEALIDPAVKAGIVAGIMKNMLAVLTEHDPTPSILHHELEAGRPSKRAKSNHNSPRPLTIAQQLEQGTYADFAALLDDIHAVASEVTAKVRDGTEKKGASIADGIEDVPLVLAKVLLFQQMAHNIATVEQSRRPGIFEHDIPPAPQLALSQKVCLTIMSQNGPLFSSLQKPTTVSTVPSVVSTPAASPSTAPTSLQSSPLKTRGALITEVAVVQPIPESVLPVAISATKVIAQPTKTTGSTATIPVRTFGENFAPPPHLRPIPPPPKGGNYRAGLSWGGKINGPLPPQILHESQTRTGLWLSYKNDTPDTRVRGGYIVGANALPKDFVAAYTSFAPTMDDSAAAVPSTLKQMVWWSRIGKAKFARLFPEFKSSGSMIAAEEEVATAEDEDAMDVDENEVEVSEEALFKEAVEKYQPHEAPVDFRLLNGEWEKEPDQTADLASLESSNQAKLQRISSLLESLYKQQHIRLSTAPPTPPRPTAGSPTPAPAVPLLGTATQPSELEIILYNDAVHELTRLISELPPHVVATVYGDKNGELMLSSIIPITSGSEVWKGTLPSGGTMKRQPMNGYAAQSPRVSHPQQVVGMGQNSIPTPQMHHMQVPQPYHPQPVRVPVNVPAPPPPSQQQQYHTSRMPQSGGTQGYVHPQQMTPQPQQSQWGGYNRMPQQAPTPGYPPQYNTRPSQPPTTPQPSRVMSPMTPTHIPQGQPQPQLYHTHGYPGQQQAPPPPRMQTPQQHPPPPPPQPQPQSQTPHYLQGIQPPPPRIIGPVNPGTPVPMHHQQIQPQPHPQQQQQLPPQPQMHHMPPQMPQTPIPQQPQVYHQHTIPQGSPAGTPTPQYHHHHSVIRNPYGQGTPVAQMGGVVPYQQGPPQQQQQQYMQPVQQQQQQPTPQMHRGMNVPPPQGLAAVGYGVPVPNMGVPGTPTPVRGYPRK